MTRPSSSRCARSSGALLHAASLCLKCHRPRAVPGGRLLSGSIDAQQPRAAHELAEQASTPAGSQGLVDAFGSR